MKHSLTRTLLVALTVFGCSAPCVLLAQASVSPSAAASPLYFPNADKNHDGVLKRSEVPAELKELRAHFDQYDSNHDHQLSEGEYVSYLNTLNSGACRDEVHTSDKCAISPYGADPQRVGNVILPGQTGNGPAVSPPKSGGM